MQREVFVEGMDHPVMAETYTLPEAAAALGRTELTIKKWLADDLIPEPILRDTQRSYRHYSRGELEVIARVLAEHELTYNYYSNRHLDTRERMMQFLHAYRVEHI